MAFKLSKVVPWGRRLHEYVEMFHLSKRDLSKKIIGFGDGPASFNYEATQQGYSVISLDIVYQFTKEQISKRIEETRCVVLQQAKKCRNYNWTVIKEAQHQKRHLTHKKTKNN